MKKSKYRELYHNQKEQNLKKEKSTVNVEKKKENIDKDKRGFNIFFDFNDNKKKSSDN